MKLIRLIYFLALWIILTFLFSLFNSSFEKYAILVQAINSLLFTTGFYFSYAFLIKPFLYKGKTVKFVILYLLVVAFLSLISMLSVYQVYVLENKKMFVENYWSDPVFFTSNYVLILLVTSTLLGFRLLKDKMQTQVLLEQVEKEKISTELSFLKAQINPHFLFNSLNNILFQIDKTNPTARETLLKFSEMLRYQLYDCGSDLIEIEKEVQYLHNYIDIQMVRKTDKYTCNLNVSDALKNFKIAPLLLIPFVENAFKHISHHSKDQNVIDISMDYRKGQFSFSVKNDKDNKPPVNINEYKGIGLANVKRRLDLLYEKKYSLEIENSENKYSVMLKMEAV